MSHCCCTCRKRGSTYGCAAARVAPERNAVQLWIDSWQSRPDVEVHGNDVFACAPPGVSACPGWAPPLAPGVKESSHQLGLWGRS